MPKPLRLACTVLTAWLLAGCEVVPSASWQIVGHALPGASREVQPVAADARFEYLQLDRGNSSLRLVLGYRTLLPLASPSGTVSVLEHWYSGDRELLVLRDGRLEQAVGLATEWRASQSVGQPDWNALLTQAEPQRWRRVRDVMPGYRYGVVDEVTSRHVAAPGADVEMPRGLGDEVAWIQEDVRSPMADGRTWVHSQWFALVQAGDRWTVRWSRQCLAPDWCLNLKSLDRSSP